jgi:chaperonin cofactor prefoldin
MSLPGFMSGDGVDPVEDELIDKQERNRNLRLRVAELEEENRKLREELENLKGGTP